MSAEANHDDAAHAAAPAATRNVRAADAGAIVEGMLELVRGTLTELLNAEAVDAALKKSQKAPAVKAMMSRIKVKGGGGAKGAKGSKQMRSNYTIFIADLMNHLKAAGQEVTISEAAAMWKAMPADVKDKLNARYGPVKDVYNAKVVSSGEASVADEMTAYAEQHRLDPVDYVNLWSKYGGNLPKSTPMPAAAAAKRPAAEAAEPPSTAGKGGKKEKKDKDKEKKHKKHKKEKKDKEAAAGGSDSE